MEGWELTVGNVSFEDWARFTWSLGCTAFSPRLWPRISAALFAITWGWEKQKQIYYKLEEKMSIKKTFWEETENSCFKFLCCNSKDNAIVESINMFNKYPLCLKVNKIGVLMDIPQKKLLEEWECIINPKRPNVLWTMNIAQTQQVQDLDYDHFISSRLSSQTNGFKHRLTVIDYINYITIDIYNWKNNCYLSQLP